MENRIKLLSSILISIFIIGSCNQGKDSIERNRFDKILQSDFPEHFPENTIDAIVLRKIIHEYVINQDTTDLTVYIKNILQKELYENDSALNNRILNSLNTDEKILKDCDYLKKVLSCKNQFQSKHFNVYNLNSKVNTEEINLYDKQYDELKKAFNDIDTIKLNLVLDTTLNYWRAFPIWDVKYGLLQRYVNGNPHELVHHFFTKYSDVPFFQEPMAFLYGDYRNDTEKFYSMFTSFNDQLTKDEYVIAKEVWHFPAIVILEKYDKLSFWLFTSTLMKKYGIEKFIEFASITTWKKNNDDFEKNFNIVYNIPLKEFEHKQVISKLK